MNYAQARQGRNINGTQINLWDWTTRNGDQIRQSPPCTLECTHTTSEEAERHFYNYCIDNAKVYESNGIQQKCRICGQWTTKSFGNNQLHLILQPIALCDEHLTKECLARASPFSIGISIIHS